MRVNEERDVMEKKLTLTPGVAGVARALQGRRGGTLEQRNAPGLIQRQVVRLDEGGIGWLPSKKPNTPIGGHLRAKVAGSGCGMASFNGAACKPIPLDSTCNSHAGQSW